MNQEQHLAFLQQARAHLLQRIKRRRQETIFDVISDGQSLAVSIDSHIQFYEIENGRWVFRAEMNDIAPACPFKEICGRRVWLENGVLLDFEAMTMAESDPISVSFDAFSLPDGAVPIYSNGNAVLVMLPGCLRLLGPVDTLYEMALEQPKRWYLSADHLVCEYEHETKLIALPSFHTFTLPSVFSRVRVLPGGMVFVPGHFIKLE